MESVIARGRLVVTSTLALAACLALVSCEKIPVETNAACTVDGLVCSGGRALECRADGSVLSVGECASSGMLCDAERGCVECTAFGAQQCVGNSFVTCSAEGQIAEARDCFAEGLVCGGSMGCATCAPGAGSCQGNSPQVCNADGSGYDTGAACGAGTNCDLGDGQCKDLCAEAAANNSYVGCDYWATTTSNGVDREFEYAIVVSNPQAVPATVTVRLAAEMDTYTVAPGTVETIRLPWLNPVFAYREVSDGEFERASLFEPEGAFHIVSDVPVTVYQFNPLEYRLDRDCPREEGAAASDGRCFAFSNDASLLLPTSVLTGDYMVVSRAAQMQRLEAFEGTGAHLVFEGGATERWSSSPGFVAIVGAGTGSVEVTVTSSAHTLGGDGVAPMRPGDTQTFNLQPGAVVELITDFPAQSSCTGEPDSQEESCPAGATPPCRSTYTYCDIDTSYDLTGTRIHASGPVAVFAGHNCAFVPSNRFACDHLEESMFPLQAWGTNVVASVTEPLRNEPNVFRIVSGADDNMISFTPEIRPAVTLRSGAFLEFEASEDFEINSTGPITVGQFLVGQSYAGRNTTEPEEGGDPSFSLGIPVEQYRRSYSFLAPLTFQESWVNVTAPVGRTVLIDGMRVGGWRAIQGSEYQTARIRIDGGAHSMSSDEPFGVSVYGFGSFTSYMYPAGLDLRVINLI